jgi:hypothetical protein
LARGRYLTGWKATFGFASDAFCYNAKSFRLPLDSEVNSLLELQMAATPHTNRVHYAMFAMIDLTVDWTLELVFSDP